MSEIITLQVKESDTKNAGYSIVRVDHADMERLGCSNDDIVQLEGKRKALARVIAEQKNSEQGFVQIDNAVRENAGITAGDRVNICKAVYTHALKVTFMPHASTKRLLQTQPLQTKYLSGLLGKVLRKELQKSGEDIRKYQQLVVGIPAAKGDTVSIHLFGHLFNFQVINTTPEGNIVFTTSTEISIVGGAFLHKHHNTVNSYGMDSE
ncbi:hypothetical protein D3C75_344640 [compost metagenome]